MVGGEQFGPYRLERLIGRGGMGEVFRAHDVESDREVAVKRLLGHMVDDPDFQKRFRRESRVAARLRNPHVIPIHTYGEIDGRLFLDMRLVEGCDLERLLVDETRLRPARAVSIVGQVASALDSAHREGLVHRDVKPSNILLDRSSGDEDFVYLADFGITRASTGHSQSLTASHVVVGSLQYMAPEQFGGSAGAPADVYSLGCVLFQCLTGTPPFEVDGLPALMKAHTDWEPPRASERRGDVPETFDEVIVRALAKDPETRHSSAAEFAREARAALDRAPVPVGPAGAIGSTLALTTPRPVADTGPDALGDGVTAPAVVRAPSAPGSGTPPDRPPHPSDPAVPAGRSSAPTQTGVPAGPGGSPPGGPPGRSGPTGPTGPARGGSGRGSLLAVLAMIVVAVVAVTVGLLATQGEGTTSTAAPSSAVPTAPGGGDEDGAPTIAPSLDTATVTATIPTNGSPETVAISPDGKSAYLTITGDNPALEVVDIASGQVLNDVPVPGPPYFVGVSPGGEHAYVTYYDRTQDQLVIGTMDTRLNQFDGAIPTGQLASQGSRLTWLFGFAISPQEPHLLYVPNHNAMSVSVLDTEKGQPVAQIPVPASPHWVALSPDGRRAYVTNHVPGDVTVIDTTTNTVVGSVPIGPGQSPHSIAVSPDGKLVEEVNYDGDSVTFIDPATNRVIASTPTGEGPQSIAFAPDGAHSYVVNEDSHDVTVIDNRDGRVTGTVPAGDGASMIAVTPDGRTGIVVNKEANTMTVLKLA